MQYKYELLLGLVLGIAWLFPFSPLGPFFALGIGALYHLIVKAQIYGDPCQKSCIKQAFATGPIFFTLSCHWLFTTIGQFGGFNLIFTALIFTGFLVLQTLSFVAIYWSIKTVSSSDLGKITKYLLIGFCSWGALEFLPSLFPWSPGHLLYGFTFGRSLASIGGAHFAFFAVYILISFVGELWIENRVEARRFKVATVVAGFLYIGLGIVSFTGESLNDKISDQGRQNSASRQVNLSLVQGNISIKDKHDPLLFGPNIRTYQRLTKEIPEDHLVIWPETVIHRFLPLNEIDKTLGLLEIGLTHGLIGALTYEDEEHFYNSALAISNGQFSGLQHKVVLMPFGEYVPFAKYFPFLNQLAGIGNFTPAGSAELIDYNIRGEKISVGILNCYEDMLPKLAFNYRGADLLVNITNDGWFSTLAMRQHALVASFRSIELGIPLVRATNSGLTSVFDAGGNLVKYLEPGQEGVLSVKLPGKRTTLYTQFGHLLNKFALLVFSVVVASSVIRKKFKSSYG